MKLSRISSGILLFFIHFNAHPNDNASIPYSFIYDRLMQINELKSLDRIESGLKLHSNNQNISPENIELILRLKDKELLFPVDKHGRINLPVVKEWKTSGYYLESNQPAGTLQLSLTINGKFPEKSTFPYQELVEITSQFRSAIKAGSGVFGLFAPKLKGLVLQYSKNEKAIVKILSKEKRLYQVSTDGTIRIPITSKLKKENPIVTVSHKPEIILPWARE